MGGLFTQSNLYNGFLANVCKTEGFKRSGKLFLVLLIRARIHWIEYHLIFEHCLFIGAVTSYQFNCGLLALVQAPVMGSQEALLNSDSQKHFQIVRSECRADLAVQCGFC